MTNAQKWVFTFLIVFVGLFMLNKYTKSEPSFADNEYAYGNSPQLADTTVDINLDAPALIKKFGCFACHGKNLQGTKLAPSLFNAAEFWNAKDLINYLKNPSDFKGTKRFDKYKEKYRTIMPPFGDKNEKDLEKIAEYILKLAK